MKQLILLLCLLACMQSGYAHGPTRQKVVEKITINAPAETVWSIVKNFHDMSWHPAIKHTDGEGGNTVGATRTLHLSATHSIEEILEKYSTPDRRYFYRITHVEVDVLPVTNYSSWLIVHSGDNNTSEVEWKGAFYRGYPNNDPPEELSDQAAVRAITSVYQAGLENLKQLAEQ